MGIANLIPGAPAGVNWAIVALAVIILLLHGLTVIKGFVKWASNVGKPRPKVVSVGSILE